MQGKEMNMDLSESHAVTLQALFLPSASSVQVFDAPAGFVPAKRLADIVCSAAILLLLSPLFLVTALLVRLSSPGPIIFWSTRFGRYNRPFAMPKFRSMYSDTPEVPTATLKSAESCITPIGRFLRRSSLDELPQLWSVLIGDMSLIGPRPVICAETDLAEKRAFHGVDQLTPGITGWAQVNGRDSVTNQEKVMLDRYYLENRSIYMDFRILYETINCVLSGSGILH